MTTNHNQEHGGAESITRPHVTQNISQTVCKLLGIYKPKKTAICTRTKEISRLLVHKIYITSEKLLHVKHHRERNVDIYKKQQLRAIYKSDHII